MLPLGDGKRRRKDRLMMNNYLNKGDVISIRA